MAGEYIWARSHKTARKRLMEEKPQSKKLTIVSRAPSLDGKYGHKGLKAYYYIYDNKKKR